MYGTFINPQNHPALWLKMPDIEHRFQSQPSFTHSRCRHGQHCSRLDRASHRCARRGTDDGRLPGVAEAFGERRLLQSGAMRKPWVMGDDGWDGIFEFLGVIANLELYLINIYKRWESPNDG